MRYWHPLSRHAALDMKGDGVARALALPLYPQYCRATTGSSVKDLQRWLRWAGADIPLAEVSSYPDHPGYVEALAEEIREALSAPGAGPGAHPLFPVRPHSVPYQSRGGRVEWLGPDTGDEVQRLGRAGVRTLAVIPASFVSEHIETLHELDIRLKETAGKAGIGTFLRVPALNDSPAFIRALRDIGLSAPAKGRRRART